MHNKMQESGLLDIHPEARPCVVVLEKLNLKNFNNQLAKPKAKPRQIEKPEINSFCDIVVRCDVHFVK